MREFNEFEALENLPHYREFTCPMCGHKQEVYILLIHINCEQCNFRGKLRGHGSIGTEIEDVIDAVLGWIGTGKEFELAMERKRAIDLFNEENRKSDEKNEQGAHE